jgi:hypothetical protein
MQRSLVLIGVVLVLLAGGAFFLIQGDASLPGQNGQIGQPDAEITRSFPEGVAVPGRNLRVRLDFNLPEKKTVTVVERVSGLGETAVKNKTVRNIQDSHIFYFVEVPESVEASKLDFSGSSPSLGIEIGGNSTVRVGQP